SSEGLPAGVSGRSCYSYVPGSPTARGGPPTAEVGARTGGQPIPGGTMRRIIGLALAGLGAFLLVAAMLSRTYLADQLVKFPLNTYVKTTLLGKDVSYFNPSPRRRVTGATMEVTDTVRGDGAAGSSSTAVWDECTYLYDTTNHVEFQYSTRRAAFDRRTGMLVDCCGANIGG